MAKETATQKAVRLAGGQKAVANSFGIRSLWSIYKWLNNNRVPAERVLPLEEMTNGQVTRYELRPDLYGRKSAA